MVTRVTVRIKIGRVGVSVRRVGDRIGIRAVVVSAGEHVEVVHRPTIRKPSSNPVNLFRRLSCQLPCCLNVNMTASHTRI